MIITSTVFENDGDIPIRYTKNGENVSPPLSWTNILPEIKGYALICEDIDAHRGQVDEPFTHWLVYNIPPFVTSLPENLEKIDQMTTPVHLSQGENSFGDIGYGGPKPPEKDSAHRYVFTLFALNVEEIAPPGADRHTVLNAIQPHILHTAQITGKYKGVKPKYDEMSGINP